MFTKLKEWLLLQFEICLGYFGYFDLTKHKEAQSIIIESHDELEMKVKGLLGAIALLQERHETDNLVITSLIELLGEEEVVLKKEFIDAVFSKQIETYIDINENNDVVCSVQLIGGDFDSENE